MDDLSVRLRAGRTYDPSDNTIHKSEFLNIWNAAGRFPSADDIVMSSFPGYRVPVYTCLKLLETQFSHSAMYNHESSLTSFDDGLPQPDPHPSHRMDMVSPPMMVRSRIPSHAHRENLHPKYYESAFSDGESQDALHTQPRTKLSNRSKDKERKQRVDTSVEDMRYPYSFALHPPVRNGRVEPTNYRHVPQGKHKTYSAGPRSRHDDSDEEDFHPPPVMLPSHGNPSSSRRSCKQCRKHQAQLVDMQKEHDQVLSDLTDYRRELAKKNEKVQELKHEVEWLRRYGKVDSESNSDLVLSDYQLERLKKHYEDKISRLERALQEMGKDCQYLREDWYRQKHKMRELETHLYQKDMELQQSEVERLASYRYHQAPWTPAVATPSGGKRYTHGRSRSNKQKNMQQEPEHAQLAVGVVSMSRTRSDGIVADVSGGESHGDPIKEQDLFDQQHRAKSLKSLQSEDSEGLHFVPTAEELKNTFKVLGEDVSKAVFPESLPEAMKLALMRALGNSHSQEDLVRTLFSYGCVPQSAEQYQELEKEYFCMKEAHEHLKVKHTTLHQTYRELKDFADSLYEQTNKHMSNEIALKVSLQYCHRVFDMMELANELSATPLSRGTTALSPHFTFDSARPPHTYASRVRQYLHDLDHDQPFQEFVSSSPSEELLSSLSLDLSQNTTSGISSATSSSIEGELTAEEMDRLKRYTRYAFAYQKRIGQTVQCLGAMEGRDVMTKYEVGLDGPPVSGTSHVVDIENAVHMEELYAIREEKAELRSRIYMLEQEKKQADLEISRKELEFHQQKKMIQQLEQRLTDERKRKRRAGRKDEGGALYPEMEEDMYESLQLQYEELYMFLKENSRKSKDNHEKCMEFIKTLHQANHALVDAYEKSMKQQRMDKKQMREELKTQLARARAPEEAACHAGETRL